MIPLEIVNFLPLQYQDDLPHKILVKGLIQHLPPLDEVGVVVGDLNKSSEVIKESLVIVDVVLRRVFRVMVDVLEDLDDEGDVFLNDSEDTVVT